MTAGLMAGLASKENSSNRLVVESRRRAMPPQKRLWKQSAPSWLLNDVSARDLQEAEMRSGFGPQRSKHSAVGDLAFPQRSEDSPDPLCDNDQR